MSNLNATGKWRYKPGFQTPVYFHREISLPPLSTTPQKHCCLYKIFWNWIGYRVCKKGLGLTAPEEEKKKNFLKIQQLLLKTTDLKRLIPPHSLQEMMIWCYHRGILRWLLETTLSKGTKGGNGNITSAQIFLIKESLLKINLKVWAESQITLLAFVGKKKESKDDISACKVFSAKPAFSPFHLLYCISSPKFTFPKKFLKWQFWTVFAVFVLTKESNVHLI